MGMGQERCAWFTQGTPTIYDAVFPQVMKKLREASGLKVDEEITRKFVPFGGYLNVDESENIDKSWNNVASMVGVEVGKLKKTILPSA